MTINGFGILLILVERIKIDIAQPGKISGKENDYEEELEVKENHN